MILQGARQLAAAPDAVWAAINDLDVLRRSLPGCEHLERLADGRIAATVVARIGPIEATFAGTLTVHDVDPPRGCRIDAEGESATAGFARGHAILHLAPDGEGTRVDYQLEVNVGGKLAQLGTRIVQGVARKMVEDSFARFTDAVEPPPAANAGPAAADDGERRALPPLVWVPGLITLVIAMLLVVARL